MSGLLDIERRGEDVAVEVMKKYSSLTALLDGDVAGVVPRRTAGGTTWPRAYAQCFNIAEFGLHSGNYIGGLRMGGMTYFGDDKDQAVCKQILGALRAIGQDDGLKDLFNNSVAAQTAGSEMWFIAVEMDRFGEGDNTGEIVDNTGQNRWNECTLELMIVCMPSRPT